MRLLSWRIGHRIHSDKVECMKAALRQANFEILQDDGSCHGEIRLYNGIHANAGTLEDSREKPLEVLEE